MPQDRKSPGFGVLPLKRTQLDGHRVIFRLDAIDENGKVFAWATAEVDARKADHSEVIAITMERLKDELKILITQGRPANV